MKRVFSLLVALCVCTGFAIAQEAYTADTTSVMSSTPSSIRPIVNDGNPPVANLLNLLARQLISCIKEQILLP